MKWLILPILFLNVLLPIQAWAISLPWPFKAKATSLKVDLQDYTGVVTTEDSGVVGVTLVYDFSDPEDQVWIESETYPELHGRLVFQGQIKSLALSEENFEKTVKRIAPEIRKRIEFFPSHLNKRKYTTRQSGGRTISFQTQSFFADDSKTYILDFDHKNGLAQLEMDKVYERPAEIDVFKSMGQFGRRHFLVTVKHDRPGLLAPGGIESSGLSERALSVRIEEELRQNRKDPKMYYEPFMDHLRREHQYGVIRAVQELIANQNNPSLDKQDYKNLKIIDDYLLERGRIDATAEVYSTQSKARRVGDAFEMRFLAFGLEPHEAWLFQFEPHLQQVENDFISLPMERSKTSAFVRTDQGFIITRSYISNAHLIEYRDGTDHVHVTMFYPDTGISRGDEFSLKVSTHPESIDQRILDQKRAGLQGSSNYYRILLDDIVSSSGSCSGLLKP